MNQVLALSLTFVLGFFILSGAFVVFMTKNNEKLIHFSISIAFGVMVALVILELFPEAKELITPLKPAPFNYFMIIGFALIGLMLLKILDLFIPDHDADNSKKGKMKNYYHVGYVASAALVLHNIIEGMALYSTARSSAKLGLLMALGIGLHNIPLGMVIASMLYHSNNDKKKTFIQIGLISISTFVGGLLMEMMSSHILTDIRLGMLLSITLGMIIYITLFELLPHILEMKDKKLSIIGIILGIVILFISQLF